MITVRSGNNTGKRGARVLPRIHVCFGFLVFRRLVFCLGAVARAPFGHQTRHKFVPRVRALRRGVVATRAARLFFREIRVFCPPAPRGEEGVVEFLWRERGARRFSSFVFPFVRVGRKPAAASTGQSRHRRKHVEQRSTSPRVLRVTDGRPALKRQIIHRPTPGNRGTLRRAVCDSAEFHFRRVGDDALHHDRVVRPDNAGVRGIRLVVPRRDPPFPATQHLEQRFGGEGLRVF
mmetsp:Transcript_11869/g.44163  ORF Transcript_11869/g.44163 Transcript_11869/m.44163 type:complete len:234 (-) Transcript_11869:1518-2219(-)